jgi:hypothetical protein
VASVCKILALGQTGAEAAVLQWAIENGIETGEAGCLPNTSHAFTRAPRTGRATGRQMAWLLENVLQPNGTLLLTLKGSLSSEQSKAIEFLGANKKLFFIFGLRCRRPAAWRDIFWNHTMSKS